MPDHNLGTLSAVVAALLDAAVSPTGRSVVGAHDEQYELGDGGDDGLIVLDLRGGDARLLPTSQRTPVFCGYTRVDFEPSVVTDLATGAITPAEAVEEGRILLRSRLYGGGQFLRLLRVAQLGGHFGGHDRSVLPVI